MQGRGRDVVKLLRPEESDYFVLKPKHSGFFSTTLETLLRYLETQIFDSDRHCRELLRAFQQQTMPTCATSTYWCPRITVSNTKKENNSALRLMKKFLKADTRSSSRIVFRDSKVQLEQRSRSET